MVTQWGVIGLGVGNQHALALLGNPYSELVGVCDRDERRLVDAARAYGQVQIFLDAGEMMESLDLDGVVIASHDWDHGPTVLDALERGLHVFVEKPVATNRDDYVAIAEALRQRPEQRLTTNTLLRRSPRFAWLKNAVVRGDFGSLVHFQGDYLYGRLNKLTQGWRGTRSDYSVTLGGTVHMIDLLLWLADERPTSVVAVGSNAGIKRGTQSQNSVFQGHSLRAGLLSFDSGLTAEVSANFASVGPHFHRVDVFGTEATFMNVPAVASGDHGEPGGAGLLLHGVDPGRVDTVSEPYPDVPKGVLVPEFVEAIVRRTASPVTEQEALDVLAVCLALDESVVTGGPINVQYEDVGERR